MAAEARARRRRWAAAASVLATLSALAAAPFAAKPAPTLYRLKINETFPEPNFPADNPLTEEGVALGRRLFFDPRLSADATISCASCHKASHAFSDPRKMSLGVGGAEGRRHSQPLFNLAWRRGLFWDGRAATIREQVLHPIQDPTEMASKSEDVITTLTRDASYVRDFGAAFPDEAISTTTLGKAFEQFLLVQISQDSRFDKAHRGETKLTPQEQRGFELFFTEFDPANGKRGGDCFHCHGNAVFTNERFANNGLTTSAADLGRFEASRKTWEKWSFKVPSLRNVGVTAPYMHDGRFATLEEVLDHYDHGVVAGPTLDPNIAKHQGPMDLSAEDKAALVAFLRSLTDDDFLRRAEGLP